MYRQYMYGSFAPVAQSSQASGGGEPKKPQARQGDPLGSLMCSLSGLLRGLGGQDTGSRLDTGDILLILILLFLFLEGDNLELVITLGLMLLLGFDDPQPAP